jgi:putative transposase
MRYPASEKLEIIKLVEQSHLPAKLTLDKLGIARRAFYRWYDRFLEGGPEALEDKVSAPSRVWNKIPVAIHDQIIELALERSELSPRELAVTFTDETTRPNQMWQSYFTYFKIIGWGWLYLSTVLDDFSRYVIAWKLCTNMRAEDVTDTLNLALQASGCDQAHVQHKPRLLSDNGLSYIAGELAEYIKSNNMSHVCGAPCHPQTPTPVFRQNRALAPDTQKQDPARKLLLAR